MIKLRTLYYRYITPTTFLTVFSSVFIRYIYYGFEYYYQLDDYIQYHNYATSLDYGQLIIQEGLLSARPLAGITDLYFWSKFYGFMIVGVLIVSVMYAFSALLLQLLFNRYFRTGLFFVAVYTLLPLGFEGTYWMSASTRIITGLFFSSIAIWLFQKICDTQKKRYIPVWLLIQLISFSFYEQVLVFSFILTVIVIIINLRTECINKTKKMSLWGVLSILNVFIYFAFTNMFSGKGIYAERINYVFPTTPYYFKVFLPEVIHQINSVFIKGGFYTLFKGFHRGIRYVITEFNWLYMIAVCIIALLIFVLSTRTNSSKHEPVYTEYTGAIISGILLTAAPVAPFFIIGNPWFSLRSAVCSFSGIALILDALIRFIFKNKNIAGIITASFVCICCVSSISELHDYKATYEYDQLVAGIILDEINDKPNLGRTGILNLNASYLEEQNFYWHEHIHGVTENDWALFGALVSISAPFNGEIVPLATDGPAYYAAWNRDTKNIAGFDTIYFWDEKREELSLLLPQKINDAEYMLYHTNGDLCAHVWEDKDYGHIKVY